MNHQANPNIPAATNPGSGGAIDPKPGNPLLLVHRRLRGKYRYALPAGLVLGVCAAFAAYTLIPDEYESIGVLEITPTSQRVLYATEQNEAVPMFDAWVEAQIGQIRSPRVMDLAMEQPRWAEQSQQLTRSEFLEDLTVSRGRGSLLIQVSYSSDDPEVSQAAVQSVIEAYRAVHIEQTNRGQVWTVDTLRALISEIALQRQSLRNAISEIAGPLSPSALSDLYAARFQEQMELESMLMTARMELAAEEALSPTQPDQAVADPDNPEAGNNEGDNDVVQLNADQLAQFDEMLGRMMRLRESQRLSLAELVDRFGENHQEVINLKRSMGVIDARIDERVAELNQIIRENQRAAEGRPVQPGVSPDEAANRPTEEVISARIASLTELREEVRQQAESLNFNITRISEIQEQIATLSDRSSDAEKRLAALQIEQENSGRVRTVNEGELPTEPANYRKRLQMTGALGLLGFGIPFGLAFLIGTLRARLNHYEDAKASWGGGAFLGILPELPGNMADPQQALVASLSVHEIRSLLQGVSEKHDTKCFMITSATAGAGKTSLALALGLSYAGAGNKTLVIDFDTIGGGLSAKIRRIVRSRLGRLLIEQGLLEESQLILAVEMAERSGRKLGETLVDLGHISDGQLSEALNRQATQNYGLKEAITCGDLAACVTETGVPNLMALPVGETSVGDVGTFARKDIRTMLVQAREQYDIVLVDTGPILGSLEAALLAKETDAAVLVLAAGEQERLVNQAIERLQHNGAELAGLIFNRARQKDVVRFSSAASQRSRMSRGSDIPMIQPNDSGGVPHEYGPIAHATAAFQPKTDEEKSDR